jgi:hypothetical protein
MKNLPRDIQELIADRLDPKSSARLRAVSREMKEVVDATRPPTGSYRRTTGRFQKRFSKRGMSQCRVKHLQHFKVMEDDHHLSKIVEHVHMLYYDRLQKAYKKNTLFRDFKSIFSGQTEEEYWQEMINILPDMASDPAFRTGTKAAWIQETREIHDFRRRVVRLLKLWARENDVYTETLRLVRRRTAVYTKDEERCHKDRLMDAIIVQTAVVHLADDPTRTIIGRDGAPLSLEQKIARLVKLCTTSVMTSTTRMTPR